MLDGNKLNLVFAEKLQAETIAKNPNAFGAALIKTSWVAYKQGIQDERDSSISATPEFLPAATEGVRGSGGGGSRTQHFSREAGDGSIQANAHAVEVCPDCDIAGCRHIRFRSHRASDMHNEFDYMVQDGIYTAEELASRRNKMVYATNPIPRDTLFDPLGKFGSQDKWFREYLIRHAIPHINQDRKTAEQTREELNETINQAIENIKDATIGEAGRSMLRQWERANRMREWVQENLYQPLASMILRETIGGIIDKEFGTPLDRNFEYKYLGNWPDKSKWTKDDNLDGTHASPEQDKPKVLNTGLATEMQYGWYSWTGGKCPVWDRVYVRVELRDGRLMVSRAKYLEWTHCGDHSDIVSFVVIKDQTSIARAEKRSWIDVKDIRGVDPNTTVLFQYADSRIDKTKAARWKQSGALRFKVL
jgi:hypothetical protein